MVRPNVNIYPVPYISREEYQQWEHYINQLSLNTNTEVTFDFEKQYFIVLGATQKECDDCSKEITNLMLSHLYKKLDKYNFVGTFEDVESVTKSGPSSSNSTGKHPLSSSMAGRFLNLDEVDRHHAQSQLLNPNYEDREAFYQYETESDDPEEEDEEFVETYTFSKTITNPKQVLTGVSNTNDKLIDYLKIIGKDTETECTLEGRKIKIIGISEEKVKEALNRFHNLQILFSRSNKSTIIVPCVHYHKEVPEFGLFFCPLKRYAYEKYVYVDGKKWTFFVILPVLKDKYGNDQRSVDLLTDEFKNQSPQRMIQNKQQPQHQKPKDLSLDERMALVFLEGRKKDIDNVNPRLTYSRTLIGRENSNYVASSSASSSQSTSNPPTVPIAENQLKQYPSYMTNVPRPTVRIPHKNTRKMTNIVPQKSNQSTFNDKSRMSNLDIIREYNLTNIKSGLTEGLNDLRGFKGNISLVAKLGKVLWTKATPEIQRKIWQFHEVKDILMNKYGVLPIFNNCTTTSTDVIKIISSFLPEPCSQSAYFEIYADVRNHPLLPYKPVIMYMSQGVVELKKAVIKTKKVTEIDWVSLDRKLDFQLLLKTEEETSTDVKPYTTFIKKVAICPNTSKITYENVPNFLKVTSILLKRKFKYKLPHSFVVEITHVEKIPITLQNLGNYGIEKFQGFTGKGDSWYDVEVFYSNHDDIFKVNNHLPVGKLADWTVEDIIGLETDKSVVLVDLICCLITIIEKYEAAI